MYVCTIHAKDNISIILYYMYTDLTYIYIYTTEHLEYITPGELGTHTYILDYISICMYGVNLVHCRYSLRQVHHRSIVDAAGTLWVQPWTSSSYDSSIVGPSTNRIICTAVLRMEAYG